MTTKVHLPDDLFPVTGRKGKRARIHENQAITNANAITSPLLRLPLEIRQMILRMVVGDKLIHLYSVFSDCSSEVDSDIEGFLQRSLCVAKVAGPCTSAPSHDATTRPSAKEAESSFDQIHTVCSDSDRHGEFDYKTFSRIFTTSRHISREALHIFWHTNRFCFETAGALKHFQMILKQFKMEHNLKHLVILYRFGATSSSKWSQITAPSRLPRLRGLATLELHIELVGLLVARSRFEENRSRVIDDCLAKFDNLRLLNLKQVLVDIPHSEHFTGKRLERGDLEAMADVVRRRLQNPVVSPQEYLADSIRKLKRSLSNTKDSVRSHKSQIQDLQQKVDADRLKVERLKVEINDLQAISQRNNTAEIEGVLETDEGAISSEEE